MNCGEPKPGGIYETCDKDLRHSDDHAYLNQRWPRPVPAEPNWNVNELLQAATPVTHGASKIAASRSLSSRRPRR